MKICILAMSGIYPLSLGGPQKAVYHLAKLWAAQGNEIDLFVKVSDETSGNLIKNQFKNVNVIPIPIEYKLTMNFFAKFPQFIADFRKSTNDYDIVYFNSPPLDITAICPHFRKGKNSKLVYDLHGGLILEKPHDIGHSPLAVNIGKKLLKLQLKSFNRIIVHSYYVKGRATEFGLSPNKLSIIRYGIDLNRFKNVEPMKLEGNPKILFVGRLENIKGIDLLVKCFPSILKIAPNAHLYIVGDGSIYNKLVALVKKLGISNFVHFEGTHFEKVPSYYASSDICVFPSRYGEGFGIVIIETMASKKPVIASAVAGMKEVIVDGVDGLQIPPNDPHAIIEKIEYLLANPQIAEQIANNGYKKVLRAFTWEKIANDYLEVFREISSL